MTEETAERTVGQDLAQTVDPLRLLAQLPLLPYQQLGDLRCGSGALTVLLAKHTYDGKVYATDDSPQARKELQERVTQARLSNVVVFDPKKENKSVLEGTLDGVLLPMVLSDAEDKMAPLARAARVLKKGGWAAVIEWNKRESPAAPPLERRVNEAEAIELGLKSGFRFSERRDLDKGHYLVILRK